jgi:TonB family protein
MKDIPNISLVLRINHAGKIEQRVIPEKGEFSIGQQRDNDIIFLDQNFPKKHVLISRQNGSYQLNIPRYVNEGELREGDSILNIRDLIVQDILPRHNNGYAIKLSPNKQGYLTFGNTRIEFLFDRRKVERQPLPSFNGFSWAHVTLKNLTTDLTFKLIASSLLILSFTVLYMFKDYVVKEDDKGSNVEDVQKRLTRFMLKVPDNVNDFDNKSANLATGDENSENSKSKENSDKNNSRGKGGKSNAAGKGNPAASAGLLGLIAGTGFSNSANSVVDALVDRGLVADLKSVLGSGTNLKVGGKKTKDGIDPLDQLIGTGGSGGIDNFLEALDNQVEEVKLTKQVRVNLSPATSKSGDSEALGYRSEQAVSAVVNSRTGRITWLYEKYLKRQPNLRGKVTVEFTIAANGFVTSARILESTINLPDLERELLNLVRHLTFDQIPSGSATFVFPFVFQKIE